MTVNIINPTNPETDEQVKQKIKKILLDEDPDVIFPTGYPTAFRGLYFDNDLEKYGVIYAREEMKMALMREDSMSYEDATEFLEYNTFNASVGSGEYAEPLYIYE